jgi:hypothetical protein
MTNWQSACVYFGLAIAIHPSYDRPLFGTFLGTVELLASMAFGIAFFRACLLVFREGSGE